MNTPPREADLNLAARRIAFVGILAAVGAALEIGTLQGARLAFAGGAGEPAWLAHPLLPAIGAALVVCVTAALLGRYLFFLPLARIRDDLAAREHVYRLLAKDSADLILEIRAGRPDRVVASSPTTLLGFDHGQTIDLFELVHDDDRAALRHAIGALSSEAARAELTVRLGSTATSLVWADLRLHRLDLVRGATETLVTVRDVTARQREAEELREATLAARRAQADADRANAAKTEFLACMSHEIRTPLNSVIGFAGLMLAKIEAASPVRIYAERIQGAGSALLTIVDDILDFSRVEAGVVALENMPFSLPSLVDECVSIVQQAALSKHLSLHVSLHDRLRRGVRGDAARLRQVLLNLLNNAIKFTEQGSVLLDIRVDRAAGRQDHIRFAVVDTGIGIAREDLPRLFHRFQQLDGSIRRTYGGTGLGLAISRKLIEIMGGTISVESERGVGSTFAFSVPLPPAALVKAPPAPMAARALRPCDVLLVEDVPINQDLMLHILEAGSHRVDIVGNGAEAVMAVQDKDYDLVLMDLQMPHVDGLTATRMIRALPHPCGSVPIVAMTANVLPEQIEIAHAAGMIDVLHKPFELSRILAVLERVVGAGAGRPSSPQAPSATKKPIEALPEAVVGETSEDALAKLVGLLGEAKVKELLAGLARSLVGRFAGDVSSDEERRTLRRQAHASVAGSGMLGFVRFAAACKAYETADDQGIEERTAALRAQASSVASVAEAMASGQMPLTISSIAA